jgi:hypothetical protein
MAIKDRVQRLMHAHDIKARGKASSSSSPLLMPLQLARRVRVEGVRIDRIHETWLGLDTRQPSSE